MLSLYIHIPFCRSKCYFCSFVISVGSDRHIDEYLESLDREAGHYRGAKIESIYIGGGTPTYLNENQLKKLVRLIRKNFRHKPDCEFTIEANPESINLNKAMLLKDLGINRLSLGIQSLNNPYLKFLGRRHKRSDALKAFRILRKVGFTNINVDMMYSFLGQTQKELKKDAQELIQLNSEHLSLYTLTVEEQSRFHIKNLKLPPSDDQADKYHFIIELLKDSPFQQYEVSNFAKPGKESRHNLNYWQGGDYIGLGVGAHSHLNGKRFWNVDKLQDYIQKTKEGIKPVKGSETLAPYKSFVETLLFGLRMNKGVQVSQLEKRFKCALDEERKEIILQFLESGWLTQKRGYLQTSDQGRLVLDELCCRLI